MTRRWSRVLLVAGGVLAVAAGVVQWSVGSRIPTWTGDKADPVALGLLTVVLGAIAIVAAVILTSPRRGVASRIAAGAAIALVAVIGFTTVGRLGWLPGPLLALGLVLGVDDWRQLGATTRRQWCRVLLVALGCCELLMVVRAHPAVTVLGVVAGVALIAAAVPAAQRWTIALAVVGPLPFAALSWSALVPVIVSIVAVGVALAVHRTPARTPVAIELVR